MQDCRSRESSKKLRVTHQEREKQGSCREEVPDVVVIKEVQQHTLSVLLPGFCWGSLEEGDADVGKVPRFNHFRV